MVEDVLDAVLHFLEPDVVAVEGLGEELLTRRKARSPLNVAVKKSS